MQCPVHVRYSEMAAINEKSGGLTKVEQVAPGISSSLVSWKSPGSSP
jgi:hypothetical protein